MKRRPVEPPSGWVHWGATRPTVAADHVIVSSPQVGGDGLSQWERVTRAEMARWHVCCIQEFPYVGDAGWIWSGECVVCGYLTGRCMTARQAAERSGDHCRAKNGVR